MTETLTEIPPHQLRVIDERTELEVRIGKLQSFVGTGTYAALTQLDQHLLLEQLTHMRAYSGLLGARIQRFT